MLTEATQYIQGRGMHKDCLQCAALQAKKVILQSPLVGKLGTGCYSMKEKVSSSHEYIFSEVKYYYVMGKPLIRTC